MGKKPAARQPSPMWVTTADLPTSAGHPFFERLNRVLEEAGFDAFVVFGYRVGARKSAKWCAASCAGADTWSMARGSGRGGGSKAPRREQEPRDKRIEELQRENVKLNEDLVRTIRDRDRWKRRSDHLEKQLDAARRAGRRQAAPFAACGKSR